MPFPCSASPAAMIASLLLALAAAPASSGQTPAAAEAKTPAAIAAVEVGFEGGYRVGKWTGVWVEWTGGPPPSEALVEITTPDGDGVPAVYSAIDRPAPSGAAAGEPRRQLVYVKFGRTPTWLSVRLRRGEQVVAERTYAAGSFPAPEPVAREAVLTLGGDVGVAEAAQLSRRRGDDAYLACSQENVAALPDRWFGYDSVDTVVLLAGNAEYLAQWSDSQVEALRGWVEQGGRLIVSSAGEPAERWRALIPGRVAGRQMLRRTTALEVYAGASQRLDNLSADRFELPLTILEAYQGEVKLQEQVAGESRPLLLLAPHGFGLVLFSAIDLADEPLASWRDRPRLVLRMLRLGDESELASRDAQRSGGRMTHIGYRDLSGQLRAALEGFRYGGLSLIPFSWVAGLIVIYLLLIGPGDYYFLRRVVGRMEFTWISFPTIALALGVAAVLLTSYFKGNSLAVRQLAVIDYDMTSGSRRSLLWAHVYSPASTRYNLALAEEGDHLLAWHGLPGSALGGMQNPAAPVVDATQYVIAAERDVADEAPGGGPALSVRPADAPINVWSTKSFFGRSWSRLPSLNEQSAAGTDAAAVHLRQIYDGRLAGRFRNPTPYELTECQLLYQRWSYSIRGTVAPGEVVYLADEGDPRDLEWKMTRRLVSDDNKPVSTPWNPNELDVPRIAEMMMFHRAAGGVGYTELRHRQLQMLDLSHHLRLGRAILVGRTTTASGGLTIDGQPVAPDDDGHWTYVRVMLPVAPQGPP